MSTHEFTCTRCGEHKTHTNPNGGGTGYGTNDKGEKICYACCADVDREQMQQDGKTDLYLVAVAGERRYQVTNWPGTLRYNCTYPQEGAHNIAGSRRDIWFTDENGAKWHGVQYGDWSDLCRCKRLKGKV